MASTQSKKRSPRGDIFNVAANSALPESIQRHLDELEAETIQILREAYNRTKPLGMLWSIGKDSTALLHCVRKAFFGRVPFPMIQLETGMEEPEVYKFRDWLVKEWGFELKIEMCPPESEMDQTLAPALRAAARKTAGLKNLMEREGYRGLVLGIRRDEEKIRGKERVFSPRRSDGTWDCEDQPAEFWGQFKTEFPDGTHVRIHPLLNWTELDIWLYTLREKIPFVPLYLAEDGERFRSLGEKNITSPVHSNASSIRAIIKELETTKIPERAGRACDGATEDGFQRLRKEGYM